MSWIEWRTYFENNAVRPLPDIPAALTELEACEVAPLLACLAKLQLGELGEGRIAHQIDRVQIAEIDDDYRRALKLMIREEGRHAAILGRLIVALGGQPLRSHYTEAWFKRGRNLLGVRWKLWVLDVAEVVSSACYDLLAEAVPAGAVQRALREIADDEAQHLAFHGELFARQLRGSSARIVAFRLAWWLCGAAACAVVIASQGAELAALGIPRRRLASSMIGQLHVGARSLIAGRA
jgi:hypothetical protein